MQRLKMAFYEDNQNLYDHDNLNLYEGAAVEIPQSQSANKSQRSRFFQNVASSFRNKLSNNPKAPCSDERAAPPLSTNASSNDVDQSNLCKTSQDRVLQYEMEINARAKKQSSASKLIKKKKSSRFTVEDLKQTEQIYQDWIAKLESQIGMQKDQVEAYEELLDRYSEVKENIRGLEEENATLKKTVVLQEESYERQLNLVQDQVQEMCAVLERQQIEVQEKKDLENEVEDMQKNLKHLTRQVSVQQENYERQLLLVQEQMEDMSSIMKEQSKQLKDKERLEAEIMDLKLQLANNRGNEDYQDQEIRTIKKERDLLRSESMKRNQFSDWKASFDRTNSSRTIISEISDAMDIKPKLNRFNDWKSNFDQVSSRTVASEATTVDLFNSR